MKRGLLCSCWKMVEISEMGCMPWPKSWPLKTFSVNELH